MARADRRQPNLTQQQQQQLFLLEKTDAEAKQPNRSTKYSRNDEGGAGAPTRTPQEEDERLWWMQQSSGSNEEREEMERIAPNLKSKNKMSNFYYNE